MAGEVGFLAGQVALAVAFHLVGEQGFLLVGLRERPEFGIEAVDAVGVFLAGLIAALFGVMLTLVGSAALGREVSDELHRIRQGEVPPDDEIRREWATVVAQAREHWQTAREDLARRRVGHRWKRR